MTDMAHGANIGKRDAIPAQHRLLILPAFGLCGLALASMLYVHARHAYMLLLSRVIIHPFKTPFFDLEYLFTTASCWRQGVDVYVTNPCDQMHRTMNLSPLWLRMGFLDIDRRWSGPFGLVLAILFCLSLHRLPPSPSWRNIAIITLAATSSLCIFALERGNIDLIIYLAALTAAHAMTRGHLARAAAYTGLLVAGLLKFYPFIGLLMLAREKLRVCIGAALACLVVIGVFFLAFHDELHRVAHNIPHDSVFSDLIGAIQLPAGLHVALQPLLAVVVAPDAASALANATFLAALALVIPLIFAAGVAVLLIRSPACRACIAGLPIMPSSSLLIGAAFLTGCFFAGQSVGYRGVQLLLVLPGLLCLDQPQIPTSLRRVFRVTIYASLIVMYRLVVTGFFERRGLYPGNSAAASLAWLGFEALWWWIIAVLLGLLGCLLIESQAGREARKTFFFEKKNQKNFTSYVYASG